MSVQIITDSAADLPTELAAALNVTVIPLTVLIDGMEYKDGVNLTPADFYAKMRAAKGLPKTSQPTPHDFMTAYRAAAERGPVVGIHISSALSGTWQGATAVAGSLKGPLRVIDSRTGSGGLARLVIEAARMAQAGGAPADIEQRVLELRGQSQTLVALNTLENAVKGGRVSPLAGMAGGLLGIRPIVHVTDEGLVEPLEKVQGRARALDRLLAIAGDDDRSWGQESVIVAHGGAPADGAAFAERVRSRFRPREVIVTEIGAAIGTYAAEGAILLAF